MTSTARRLDSSPLPAGLRTAPSADTELDALYAAFAEAHLNPLWTQIGDLMPTTPASTAVAHVWRWADMLPLAERAGDLVPVGRGGERRAIALANPGLGGRPYVSPTLWAAIQYLGGRETAPEHRHSQNAFRFVLHGEGVWTVVDGDPVAMRRGDLLLTPGWHFHGHHNETDDPMVWLDGLDIPLSQHLDTGFFDVGRDGVSDMSTPHVSRAERLWAHPGLRPLVGLDETSSSPIPAYRWEHTDAALREQLSLSDEGYPAVPEPGHAAIRYTNPTTGGDVLPTIRAEFHRILPDARTAPRHDVGSTVFQVFAGGGTITLGDDDPRPLRVGDVVVVPSWVPWSITGRTEGAAGSSKSTGDLGTPPETASGIDLFAFSDAPVMERLHFHRPLDHRR
ncbi:cupin domain-containing protein [Gordonia sinesedis]